MLYAILSMVDIAEPTSYISSLHGKLASWGKSGMLVVKMACNWAWPSTTLGYKSVPPTELDLMIATHTRVTTPGRDYLEVTSSLGIPGINDKEWSEATKRNGSYTQLPTILTLLYYSSILLPSFIPFSPYQYVVKRKYYNRAFHFRIPN